MPPTKTQKVPCSFYLTNSCKKGDRCPFSHGLESSPRMVCKHFSSGSCMFGDLCRNSHALPEAKPASTELRCVFWKSGSCTKGDHCRFLHEPITSDSTLWRGRPSTLPPAADDAKPARKDTPCLFWKSGHCSKRAQCEFSHDAPTFNPHSPHETQEDQSSRVAFGRRIGSRPNDHAQHMGKTKIVGQEASKKSDQHGQTDGGNFQRSETDVQEKISRSSESVHDDQIPNEIPHSEPTVERSFLDGVRASIGPGGVIHKVITAFESCRVTLANIPDQTSHQEIITMADAFGPLKSVVLNPPAPGIKRKAELEYLDPDCAKMAATVLDGVELHTRCLAAQLNLRSAETGTADLRSSTLKMSWFAPTRMAYAHYGSISEAKERAIILNDMSFCGQKVSAIFQQPSPRQRINFTVIIKNLPLHVKLDELKNFCRTESVDLSQASYYGKDGIARVQELLETFGPLESFDRSHPSPADVKVKALARFTKPEHAATATEKLRGQSQSFLGGAKTWVTLLHSIKYNIPKAQYSILESDLRRLQSGDATTAKVRVYDKDEQGRRVDPVCIRIYGDDPKMLGRLKAQIEALVSGEEVSHEGVALWDEFFLSKKSAAFADEVQAKSKAFILLDSRRRKIRVSGSVHEKNRARELLLQKVLKLRTQRHQLSLTKTELGRLLQGEFTRLQGVLGEDKLFLDVRKRVLIIRGDEGDILAARLSLDTMQANTASPANSGDNQAADCPVCFCETTTPVTLACGHSYCFACLRHYLASAESFPVKCLAEDGRCDLPIPLRVISDMLPPGDETKFFDDAFLAYIHQRPKEFHYCPSPDCQQIYRPTESGSILRCPSCLSRICPSCHIEFHEGLTCAEHRDNQSGGVFAFQKWKEDNNVHSCPNCKVDIEKSMGCNHITCIRCGSHICWVCLKTWPDASVIYNHMSSVHGGLGL